ncbi:MAG: threonine synthase [Chloroflexota bacterium]
MKRKITYQSTNGKISGVSFRDALLKGLAPDGGLFMPDKIPFFSEDELDSFRNMAFHEIATEIIDKYTSGDIRREDLKKLCRDAFNFPVPIESVTEKKYILRLDHGPTASFKDFAARMMSRLMQHFLALEKRNLTILTATSGDTGSAVANAFLGLLNIRVIVLFPEDEVSLMQRKQMTTLGGNITTVAVNGKFDDCQGLVKKAFLDPALSHLPLTSANSINIGRLLPQSVYYFYAWSRVTSTRSDKVIFSVPSGNFGNVTAGLFAKKMGLPVEKFIVSTNSNDEFPVYLRTGSYVPIVPSVKCISSAMNVGHPSNLPRILSLYGGIMDEKGNILRQPSEKLKDEIFSVKVSDEDTLSVIADAFSELNVLLEPHGAVAWKGIEEYIDNQRNENYIYISLETAHPAKFPEELVKILNFAPVLPDSLAQLDSKKEFFQTINPEYSQLKEIILQNR